MKTTEVRVVVQASPVRARRGVFALNSLSQIVFCERLRAPTPEVIVMLSADAALRVRKDFKPHVTLALNVGIIMSKDMKRTDFEAAAMPFLNEIFGVAARLVGNRAEAEDLVQEVYMQAWKSFHCFELGTNCRAWLFRILFNKHHHHRRKLMRWRRIKTDDANLEQIPCKDSPVSEHLSDTEILLALERLRHCYREVVLLADVQDFSYKEIAAILHVPVGTVMSRLSRGRKLLRSELADVAATYGIKQTQTNI